MFALGGAECRRQGSLVGPAGTRVDMRLGQNVEVRPLGGGAGCLGMVVGSIVVSVLLTVILNLVVR